MSFRKRTSSAITSRFGAHSKLKSEINVTPFVDVMLVLLIIFMVTSPMLISGIEIDLPQTTTAPLSNNDEPLVISMNKNHEIYLQEEKIQLNKLEVKLMHILKEKPDTKIFVRGDKSIGYGDVMSLFGILQNIGFKNISLVTEISDNDDSHIIQNKTTSSNKK